MYVCWVCTRMLIFQYSLPSNSTVKKWISLHYSGPAFERPERGYTDHRRSVVNKHSVRRRWSCLSTCRLYQSFRHRSFSVREQRWAWADLVDAETLLSSVVDGRQPCQSAVHWVRRRHRALPARLRYVVYSILYYEARRAARKDRCHSASSTSATYTCDTCGRTCSSRIGLFSHQRSHRWDSSRRRLIPEYYEAHGEQLSGKPKNVRISDRRLGSARNFQHLESGYTCRRRRKDHRLCHLCS